MHNLHLGCFRSHLHHVHFAMMDVKSFVLAGVKHTSVTTTTDMWSSNVTLPHVQNYSHTNSNTSCEKYWLHQHCTVCDSIKCYLLHVSPTVLGVGWSHSNRFYVTFIRNRRVLQSPKSL